MIPILNQSQINSILFVCFGVFAFVVIRIGTQRLGYYFERLQERNIIFAGLKESGSDVRNLGRGLAFFALLSVPIGLEWHSMLNLILNGLRSYFVLILGTFAVTFLNVWEIWRINRVDPKLSAKDRQFALTLYPLIANTGKYVVYFFGIMLIFSVWGVDILPVLGGLGIVGIIIGIGANSLVNDLISGIFIIFERLYYVGSEIEIILSDKVVASGEVTRITWRISYIKESSTGHIIAIANRNLSVIRIIRK